MANYRQLRSFKQGIILALSILLFALLSPKIAADAALQSASVVAGSVETSSSQEQSFPVDSDDGEDFEIEAEEDVLYLDQETEGAPPDQEEQAPAVTIDVMQRLYIMVAVASFGIFVGLLTFIIVSFRKSKRRA